MQIKCILGDITKQTTDVIVNSASLSLSGGGGVDRAIHRVAGKELLKECLKLGGCKFGEAKATKGYALPAKHIIHTVAPVYGRMQGKEADLLADCYRNSLKLADKLKAKSVSFPSLAIGAFEYPTPEAVKIAFRAVKSMANPKSVNIEEVVFVLFSKPDFHIYNNVLKQEELQDIYPPFPLSLLRTLDLIGKRNPETNNGNEQKNL